MRIRQRAIVSTSFNVMFEALVPLIAFAWLDDERLALTFASLGVAAYVTGIVVWRARQLVSAGGPMTPIGIALFSLGPIATVLFWANALVFGSVAVFALALCVQLSIAVIAFYSLVSAAQS